MPGGETVEDGKISRKAFEKTSGAGVPTRRLTATSVLLFAATICSGCTQRVPIATELTSPLRITANRTTPRQTIHVLNPSDEGAIVIEQDGVVLDLGRSELIGAAEHTPPDEYVGRGIVVRNARNVTIRNAIICEFKVAIYSENAPGLTIDHCDVSRNYRQRLKSTPLREHPDDWLFGHENDQNEWLRYGAGIYLLRCDGAKVFNCRARDGQNGICLVRTNNALVESNDIAFMSGWGLAMWRSSFCRVIGNRFDYCVRGYSHGVYARGQDSTGILVYEQSSDNLFAYNSATHGGDGFFLYAGNETLRKTGKGGCNRNVIYGNDFSYALANGIEATFSERNAFIGNRLMGCDHGIWAGYSRNSLIAQNYIGYCENGISIEHGSSNTIEKNMFDFCRRGVHLWRDEDADLLASPYCRVGTCASQEEIVRANQFLDCDTAILAEHSINLTLDRNTIEKGDRCLIGAGETTLQSFSGNALLDGQVENNTGRAWRANNNFVAGTVQTVGIITWEDPAAKRSVGWTPSDCGVAAAYERAQALRDTGLPAAGSELSSALCECRGCDESRRERLWRKTWGKENIVIGEWGPYGYERGSKSAATRQFVLGDEALIQVIGPNVPFRVHVLSGEIEVSPKTGMAPEIVKISRRNESPGLAAYRLRVGTPLETHEFSGILIGAAWAVAYYCWFEETDPRSGEDVWQRIISAEPLRSETINHLDLVWGGAGPEGLPSGDRFAVVATTTMRLRPGRWRIRTISDDGIRVYVDENRVIDNWTWHVPTEDVAEFDSPGAVHALRVEYFEIDGHAQLQLFLEPALAREHGLSLIRTSSEAASSSHRD